ncbi:MAG: hypothetical protein ABL985_13895 [Casimicrobium sp.]
MNELECRFKAFMASLPDAEEIDSIKLPERFRGARRADYFLGERKIVVELKSLEVDPSEKIESVLEARRKDEDFPQFFGESELGKVLAKLPDGDALRQRIHTRLTRSIEGAIRSAKEQIASTRKIFDCPDADGVVVLLNADVEVLDPKLVGRKCHELLRNIDNAQERINLIWYVQATHRRRSSGTLAVIPSFIAASQRWPISPSAKLRIDRLIPERASFGGVPFLGHESAHVIEQLISNRTEARLNATEKKRYGWWQDEYRATPYLRRLSDDAVLEHAARIVTAAQDFFVIDPKEGKTKRSAQNEPHTLSEIMRGFTHCQIEMTDRVLDVRRLREVLAALRSATDSATRD